MYKITKGNQNQTEISENQNWNRKVWKPVIKTDEIKNQKLKPISLIVDINFYSYYLNHQRCSLRSVIRDSMRCIFIKTLMIQKKISC